MFCGDFTYDEWLNMWFSHHLYGVDNGIMELFPAVLAQDNASGEWISYDAWDSQEAIVLTDAHRVRPIFPFQAMGLHRGRVFEEPDHHYIEFPLLDHTPLPEPVVLDAERAAANRARSFQQAMAVTPPVFAPDSSENFTIINSLYGSASWQNFINAPTAASSVYHFELTEDVAIKGVAVANIRAAITSLGDNANERLRMFAILAEVAADGTTLNFFGGNNMGSTIAVDVIQPGGSWQGGGITSHNLVQFRQSTAGTFREIARGWMDLANPKAGWWSYTSCRELSINARENLGVFHDYTLYLQPAIHTATAGNKLVLIITNGSSLATGTRTAAATGANQFTFTIDNAATNIVIPVALPVVMITAQVEPTITVVEGEISGELTVIASATMGRTPTFQWYSNTVNSNTGGTAIHGATSASFTIPTDLTEGTYYFYVVVSAPGAASAASNVAAVIVEPEPVEPTPEPGPNGGGGCNVGIPALIILGLAGLMLRRKF